MTDTLNLITDSESEAYAQCCAQRNAALAEIKRLRHLIRYLIPKDLDDEKGIWVDGASGQWRFWHSANVLQLVREAVGDE